MFQRLILCLIFSSVSSVYARSPGTYTQLKFELQKVTQRNLVEWVNGLVGVSSPSRMVGLPGHEKAKGFIQENILKLDPKGSGKLIVTSTPPDIEAIKKFYRKDFNEKVEGKFPPQHPEYKKWLRFTQFMESLAESKKTTPVENIVWEKAGIHPNKLLLVTAHYDTISHEKDSLLVKEATPMPGANYNASGVSVALGLLKVLSQIDLNYSVRIVFLDWQGIGFHGSFQYAKELKASGKEVMGVVNLEMLGQDSSFFDKTKKTGNMSVYLRKDLEEEKWVKKLIDRGSKTDQKVTFEVKPNQFESSDNFRFWEQGFLSATFTQNWEDDFNPKFYQTPQDTPETLNHETLWHAYQFLGGAVIGTVLDLAL